MRSNRAPLPALGGRGALAGVAVALAACTSGYGSAEPLHAVDAPSPGAPSAQDGAPGQPTPSSTTDLPPRGGPDPASASSCDPTRPFGAPVTVGGFAYPEGDYGPPRLSADELTLFVSIAKPSGGAGLYTATRASRTSAFGPAQPVVGVANAPSYDLYPNVSADGLSMIFEGVPGVNGASSSLFVATRSSAFAPFGSPSALPISPTVNPEQAYVLGRGNALYFANGRIARAATPTWATVGEVTPVTEIADAAWGNIGPRFPVVRADELAIYWQASTANGALGSFDLYAATRATTSAPFSNVHKLTELSTAVDDYPSWISPDGCRLYVLAFDATDVSAPVATLKMASLAP